jgi:hypothetical protein
MPCSYLTCAGGSIGIPMTLPSTYAAQLLAGQDERQEQALMPHAGTGLAPVNRTPTQFAAKSPAVVSSQRPIRTE